MRRLAAAALVALVLLAACDAGAASAARRRPRRSRPSADRRSVGRRRAPAAVEPAPGSDSEVYAPNPEAIVVAIDAGHGGCLDWGVPDPSQRGVELAEKTMTLVIGAAPARSARGRGHRRGHDPRRRRGAGRRSLSGPRLRWATVARRRRRRQCRLRGDRAHPHPRRAPGPHRPRQPGRRRCVRQHPHQLADGGRPGDRGRLRPDLLRRRDGVGARRQRRAWPMRSSAAPWPPSTR